MNMFTETKEVDEIKETAHEIFTGISHEAIEKFDTLMDMEEPETPDMEQEYWSNGNRYETDSAGNIIFCEAKPVFTEGGIRNVKEQREAGGEERQEGDDGGHIVAKMLGGSEGKENLVPMRSTVNRGDYKRMENEIARALLEGKDVDFFKVNLTYEEYSKRPSVIHAEYKIENETHVTEYDNKKNSVEFMNHLENKIYQEDYNELRDELNDMREDGIDVSITSVKKDYDDEGMLNKITIGVCDESTGLKSYKVYEADPDKEVRYEAGNDHF